MEDYFLVLSPTFGPGALGPHFWAKFPLLGLEEQKVGGTVHFHFNERSHYFIALRDLVTNWLGLELLVGRSSYVRLPLLLSPFSPTFPDIPITHATPPRFSLLLSLHVGKQ